MRAGRRVLALRSTHRRGSNEVTGWRVFPLGHVVEVGYQKIHRFRPAKDHTLLSAEIEPGLIGGLTLDRDHGLHPFLATQLVPVTHDLAEGHT